MYRPLLVILGALLNLSSVFGSCAKVPDDGIMVIPKTMVSIPHAAFYKCTKLKELKVESGSALVSIGNEAFAHCTSLATLNLPSSLETVGSGAFYNCTELRSVILPDRVKYIPDVSFTHCTNLQELKLGSALVSIGMGAFAYCTYLRELKFGSALVSIGRLAFAHCTSLVTLNLPSSLEKIGNSAFFQAASLSALTIPNSVTNLDSHSFMRCISLTKVTIGDKLEIIGSLSFLGCASLKHVIFGRGLKRVEVSAFSQCHQLETVDMSRSKLEEIGDEAFAYCAHKLQTLSFPETLTTIGHSSFAFCLSLWEVNLPDSVTKIGNLSFSHLPNLMSVTIGAGLKVVPYGAFYSSKNLKKVTLGRSLERVGVGAFFKDVSLQEVELPASVRIVDFAAFSTTGIKNLTIKSYDIFLDDNSFDDTPKLRSENVFFMKGALVNISQGAGISLKVTCNDTAMVCGCGRGYGSNITHIDMYNCVPCGEGLTSRAVDQTCEKCERGKYSGKNDLECRGCPRGRSGDTFGAKSKDVCKKCTRGRYAPSTGMSKCEACPPGTKCPEVGLSFYRRCSTGKYSRQEGQWNCSLCDYGYYQPEKGQVFCHACPIGKYGNEQNATTKSTCLPCGRGRYGDKTGIGSCTVCHRGTYQPNEGQTQCTDCGGTQSNADFTGCVEAASVMGVLFDTGNGGVAIYGTILICLFFVGVAVVITAIREKDPDRLANYPRSSALWNSFLPGFGFGSFIFLVAAVIETKPGIAVAIIMSRLLHMFGSAFILFTLFGPAELTLNRTRLQQNRPFLRELSLLRDLIDKDFARNNTYLIEIVSFLSLSDCTMLQFMPWRKSKYYTASEGYITSTLMKYSLTIKVIETSVNAICEIVYLSELNHGVDTTQDKALALARVLFILNLIVGISMVLIQLLVLFIRSGILNGAEEASLEDARENNPLATNNTVGNLDAWEIYKTKRDSILEYSENPLYASSISLSEPQAKDMEMAKSKKDDSELVDENDRKTVLASHDSSKGPESVKDDVEFHI